MGDYWNTIEYSRAGRFQKSHDCDMLPGGALRCMILEKFEMTQIPRCLTT
jgi:hypothetical protein